MDLDLNNLDFSEIGSWPLAARLGVVALLFVAVLGLGYWFDTQEQLKQLKAAEAAEVELKGVFGAKAHKAANLEAYREQLAEMKESFGAMLRQLPNRTEVADLLVDVSQTGLASGLEFELFQPSAEMPQDFYAELPISIKVRGNFHEFGAFVSGVAALPRIVTLHNINIEQAKDKDDERLAMSLTAKTYRYMEEDQSDTEGQGGGTVNLMHVSRARCVLLLLAGLGLAGCEETGMRDLEVHVQDVLSKQRVQIEPLPEFVPYETFLYQAGELRDPFSPPVVSQVPVISRSVGSGVQPDARRSPEPLEAFPLDTLRMVGTMEKNNQSWALIKASDGTIHRVKPGNYMGQNHGKINQISEYQVGLVEIVPDGLGGWMEREAALALSE